MEQIKIIKEAIEDLEARIQAEYSGSSLTFPTIKRRMDRDMTVVTKALTALAQLETGMQPTGNKIAKFMEILEDTTIDFEGQIHNEAFASRVLTKMGCFDCDNGLQACYMSCSEPTKYDMADDAMYLSEKPTTNEDLIDRIDDHIYKHEQSLNPKWRIHNVESLMLLRDCKTALSQVKPSIWQPIESAPKDGSEILIWGTLYNMGVADNSWHIGRYSRGWWSDDKATISHATHWQPLPPAPTIGVEE